MRYKIRLKSSDAIDFSYYKKVKLTGLIYALFPISFLLPNAFDTLASPIVKLLSATLLISLFSVFLLSLKITSLSIKQLCTSPAIIIFAIWTTAATQGLLHEAISLEAFAYLTFKILSLGLLALITSINLRYGINSEKHFICAATIAPALSLFLFFFGFKNDIYAWFDESLNFKAITLSSIGIETERVRFIFASGINAFATHAGILVIAGLLILKDGRNLTLGIPLTIAGIVALLLIDSRSLMVLAPASVLIAKWVTLKNNSTIFILVLSAPILPAAMLIISALFETHGITLPLGREGEDLTTLNARTKIWAAAFSAITDKNFHHLTGYGAYGSAISGITDRLALVGFDQVADVDRLTMHNAYLQYFIDSGAVGLILYMFANYLAIRELRKAVIKFGYVSYRIALAGFVLFLLLGNTEVCGALYGDDSFPLYALLLSCALTAQIKNCTHPALLNIKAHNSPQ